MFNTVLLIGIAIGVGTIISYLGQLVKQNKRIIELMEKKDR
ncbi:MULTISPECIES: hypothetical protein [Bacillaceae]|nr:MULTISPECIES: hypothetical protein [Bacillaceae]